MMLHVSCARDALGYVVEMSATQYKV